jgi:hypothetical protein
VDTHLTLMACKDFLQIYHGVNKIIPLNFAVFIFQRMIARLVDLDYFSIRSPVNNWLITS